MAVGADRGRGIREDDDGRGGHGSHRRHAVHCIGEPASRQPDSDDGHHPTAGAASLLDVAAHDVEGVPKPPLHGGFAESHAARDLAVGESAEVRELHELRLFAADRVHRLANRLTHHRVGKLLPRVGLVEPDVHALEEHLLQADVRPAYPAPVHRVAAHAGEQPRTPRVVGCFEHRAVIEAAHLHLGCARVVPKAGLVRFFG